jgi:hypothetical protein
MQQRHPSGQPFKTPAGMMALFFFFTFLQVNRLLNHRSICRRDGDG